MSDQSTNLRKAGHVSVAHPDILNDPDVIDVAYPGNMSEKSHIIFVRAVDKQVPYLLSLTVEISGKPIIDGSNWPPPPSAISCLTRQFCITGSGRIEVVHQNVTAPQVVSNGVQIVPVPYFNRTRSTAYHPRN
jgi:hypothetical protein